MEYLEIYSNIWSVIETCGFLFVILIFFKDPIRRWNFFGYRPTAVMGLYDPYHKKVLVIRKKNEGWFSLSQGGIYNPDLNFTTAEILFRELGLEQTRFGLRFTSPLGVIRINDPELTNRATISTISAVKKLRGKGYIACFVRINLENIDEVIKKGEDVGEVTVTTIEEARKLVKGDSEVDVYHANKKLSMIMSMFDRIEEGFKRYEKKHNQTEEKSEEKSEDS